MNQQQQEVIGEVKKDCPSMAGVFERAYSGASRASAIKAMCLRCVGYARDDVAGCTAYACPLHPYRPFQKGETGEESD